MSDYPPLNVVRERAALANKVAGALVGYEVVAASEPVYQASITALACVEDVVKLCNTLDSILALHWAEEATRTVAGVKAQYDACPTCSEAWPCPTFTAIATVLEERP